MLLVHIWTIASIFENTVGGSVMSLHIKQSLSPRWGRIVTTLCDGVGLYVIPDGHHALASNIRYSYVSPTLRWPKLVAVLASRWIIPSLLVIVMFRFWQEQFWMRCFFAGLTIWSTLALCFPSTALFACICRHLLAITTAMPLFSVLNPNCNLLDYELYELNDATVFLVCMFTR